MILNIYLGIIMLDIAVDKFTKISAKSDFGNEDKPRYFMPGGRGYYRGRKHMTQVHSVLKILGYSETTNGNAWDLLYDASVISHLASLKPEQKVNHYPGGKFIRNKVDFATSSDSKYVPKAFGFPRDKAEFLKYVAANKNATFIQKNNRHRGVKLVNLTGINFDGYNFVQRFIHNPFLVDGYMFDLAVFVVITSVSPLRIYYYTGDIFLRFCPEKYYPFDPRNVKKYVVGDNYRHIEKVPSLAQMVGMGYSMKDAFSFYLRSKGKDPRIIYSEILNAIRETLVNKEKSIIKTLKMYKSKHNFFELFRVDMILDREMAVHVTEYNGPPYLYSSHPPLQLLNDQVLYNYFTLVGLSSPHRVYPTRFSTKACRKSSFCTRKKKGANMLATTKNILVWPTACGYWCNKKCGGTCEICPQCLSNAYRLVLLEAYREHLRKGDFARLYPPPMKPLNGTVKDLISLTDSIQNLTTENRLMYLWYQGKCNEDVTWCGYY